MPYGMHAGITHLEEVQEGTHKFSPTLMQGYHWVPGACLHVLLHSDNYSMKSDRLHRCSDLSQGILCVLHN
jgi:hypothetical protein